MSKTVIVGATGQTGRRVAQAMRERGAEVTGMIRDAPHRHVVADSDAHRVVHGDLEDQASMRAAFAGADTVLVIPPVLHPREDQLVANAVAAATAAGVERFVFYSALHPYTPAIPHHLRKARAEVAVRASSMRWTILQPAMYAQTVLRYRSQQYPTEFRIPWNPGRQFSVIDLGDIAEAVALTVLSDEHDFACYELAGPEALSMQAMVAQLAELVRAPLRAVAIGPAQFDAPSTWSPSAKTDIIAMFTEYDAHGLLGNPAVLRGLLGREPTTFGEAMRRDSPTAGG